MRRSNFYYHNFIKYKCKKNCCFITICKALGKMTHIKQQNIFITSSAIRPISTALQVMKILLLFYMYHFAMGLTHCYKTAVFKIDIFSFSIKFNL